MALQGSYNADIEIQEVVAGNDFSGVASNGTLDTLDTVAPYYGGRVKFTGGGTDGGLFSSIPNQGRAVVAIVYHGPGTTRFVASLRQELYPSGSPVVTESKILDTDLVGPMDNIGGGGAVTLDPASFIYIPREPILLVPGTFLKCVTTGNISGMNVGRIEVRFGYGWGQRSSVLVEG